MIFTQRVNKNRTSELTIYIPRLKGEQNSKINISLSSFEGKQRVVKPPHSSRLAFQNKKLVEESNIVFALFLGVFIFLSVYELFY